MGLDRKKKLKKQAEKSQRQRARVREDYARILSLMGVHETFQRLSASLKEWMYQFRFPRPDVTIGEGFKNAKQAETLQVAIRQVFDQLRFKGPEGQEFTATDYFRICISIREALTLINKKARLAPDVAALVSEAARQAELFCNDMYLDEVWDQSFDRIDEVLTDFTRIDEAIYWYKSEFKWMDQGKGILQFTIHRENPQRVTIVADGVPRTAYRCGLPYSGGGEHVYWISIPARSLGIDSDETYPVYVQSHVLKRLQERITLTDGAGLVHDSMLKSLYNLTANVQREGKALVEYWMLGYKLGYFEVERIGEIALVRTFLFLTMEGTPEAEALWKRLRLKRADLNHLGLHLYDTFMLTDIQADEELAAVFAECGCGHLLEMSRPEFRNEWVKGYARSVRQYLGMKLD